jgi:glycosyltransferase involved in cell wall biosynthesis
MRIFVPHASDTLTDHLAHGDGLVAWEVVTRLARRGHEVHVASPRIDVTGEVPRTLRLHELSPLGGVPLVGRLGYMVAVRRLYETLRRDGPIDVVHQLNPVFTGISLAFEGTHVPVVLGSFVGDWPGSEGRRATRIVKRTIASLQQRSARALLVTTPAARSRIVRCVRDGEKIRTLPHGIDPWQYAASLPSAAEPTIIFLGGLERRKGIYTLLDAFVEVARALPESRLLVAGFGTEWVRARNAAAALPCSDRITFLGGVRREDVAGLMERARVFCLPSFGEPFGMALLEAMACGKPVVVTAAGGAAHIVDERGGRKVPPGNPAALAAALVEILAEPELADRMGRHNRRVVEEVYGWDNVISQLEEIYRSLLRTAS